MEAHKYIFHHYSTDRNKKTVVHRESSDFYTEIDFISNTTIQLKVDTFNWTLCAQQGT